MTNPTITLIERRISANRFDAGHRLTGAEIEDLARLATRAQGVIREFGLLRHEVPVMLVAVGRAAPGNWPQKPRRPLTEVLEIA
jgi:hypothetical protein